MLSHIESSTSGASHTQHIPNSTLALMIWNPSSQDLDVVRPFFDVLHVLHVRGPLTIGALNRQCSSSRWAMFHLVQVRASDHRPLPTLPACRTSPSQQSSTQEEVCSCSSHPQLHDGVVFQQRTFTTRDAFQPRVSCVWLTASFEPFARPD